MKLLDLPMVLGLQLNDVISMLILECKLALQHSLLDLLGLSIEDAKVFLFQFIYLLFQILVSGGGALRKTYVFDLAEVNL